MAISQNLILPKCHSSKRPWQAYSCPRFRTPLNFCRPISSPQMKLISICRVNSKNNIYWGSTLPETLHSKKVTACSGMFPGGIIRPFFEEIGATATVNSERYIGVLERFYTELQAHYPSYMKRLWFQQDGATPNS